MVMNTTKIMLKNIVKLVTLNIMKATMGNPIVAKVASSVIITLALCFTTGVGDVHSIFGKYKFITNPKIAVRKQYTLEITMLKLKLTKLSFKPRKKRIFANILSGKVIIKLNIILPKKISLIWRGKDFIIHKFLPSKEIDELVVEDKPIPKIIIPKTIKENILFA